ncbi:hypothetical protein [Chitinophaga sp. MM2321]|uniref:hypothetical protein n=1 Tax=Chitinophaga sp. MM2321 TaxID=3137178 RepID=UPI0032D58D20
MKRIILTAFVVLTGLQALACPVCERQQKGILGGFTHGGTPGSNWDYLIVWVTVIIVLFTLFFSVKWLVHPGEKSDSHIKRNILNNE